MIGHNEAPTLAEALDQARQAATKGDQVCFVDSASTDSSKQIALSKGVRVIDAPLGKGRAVATLLRHCETEFVCCLDGDLVGSERNIAQELATAVRRAQGDLILGSFTDPVASVLSNTVGIYEPLVAALFPEVAGRCGSKPLTGFRAFRVSGAGPIDEIPPDFGVETHLNVVFGLSERQIHVSEIGCYAGRFLYKPTMGLEIADAILSLAERHRRIRRTQRPEWDAWVKPVVELISTYRGEDREREAFRGRLTLLAKRPTPQLASAA